MTISQEILILVAGVSFGGALTFIGVAWETESARWLWFTFMFALLCEFSIYEAWRS